MQKTTQLHIDIHYHNHCQDGLGAVASALNGLHNIDTSNCFLIETRGRKINEAIESEVYSPENAMVVYVDYCPVAEELERLSKSNLVIILDHHKTSENILNGVGNPIKDVFDAIKLLEAKTTGVFKIFDMNKAGTGISWNFFNPGKKLPRILNVVNKRDLWLFDEEHIEAVSTYLDSLKLTVQDMVKLIQTETHESFERIKESALDLQRYKMSLVESLARGKHYVKVEHGMSIIFCNSQTLHSDLGNHLLNDEDHNRIAVVYHLNTFHRFVKLSVRSRKGDSFARRVAEKLGGGGHDSASGVNIEGTVDLDEVISKVVSASKEVIQEEKELHSNGGPF